MITPKISIIVPVYRVEQYLHRCVDSIMDQSFTDFELILVDDGSPDNCGEICDEYAKKDRRIRVFHKENGGVSSARNLGIDNSFGEYISFVDADDFISLNWLECLYEKAISSNADIIVASYTKSSKCGNKSCRIDEAEIVNTSQEAKFEYLCRLLLHDGFGWEVWSRLFKRSLIVDNKIEMQGTFAEDMSFCARCSLLSKIIYHIDNCDYYYNVDNPVSAMSLSKDKIRLNDFNDVSFDIFHVFKSIVPNYYGLFPVVHYLVMNEQYKKINSQSLDFNVMPSIIGGISKQEWYIERTSELKKCKRHMIKKFGHVFTEKALYFSACVVNEKWNNYSEKIRWIDRKYSCISKLMFWR